jgi:hypothetical protein
VKTPPRILATLFSLAILGLGYGYTVVLRDETNYCDTITLDGEIGPETFVGLRECLIRSTAPKKTFVVRESAGGDSAAGLALGILIHRHNWDVEVFGLCASACANFIFPAGKTKFLHQHSMLAFHGGLYQENLLELTKKVEQGSSMNGATAGSLSLGQVAKENTVFLGPQTAAYKEVHQFLSIADASTPVEIVRALRTASDQLYQELGINPLLNTYGQLGTYEPIYKSYKYFGFIYRLDSLRKFGIGNIELKDGEWHPELNPAYPEVYEVTYP